MSEIALYNLLRRIPDVSDDEAKEAVADVASSKDVATKADIKDMATKADLAELKEQITWRLVLVLGVYTAVLGFIIKAI